MDTKDILLGIIGLISLVYGTWEKDLVAVIMGIVLIFLTIQLNLQDLEEDVRIIKAQINTQSELKRI